MIRASGGGSRPVGFPSPNHWSTEYELAFALHLEAAECEYLCGSFEEAERDFDRLLTKARTKLDKAKIYSLKILQYEHTSRYADAIPADRNLAIVRRQVVDLNAARQASDAGPHRHHPNQFLARDAGDGARHSGGLPEQFAAHGRGRSPGGHLRLVGAAQDLADQLLDPGALSLVANDRERLRARLQSHGGSEQLGRLVCDQADGTIVGRFGRAGKLLKEFGTVNAIDCRSENNLLVGEIGNMRVQKLALH